MPDINFLQLLDEALKPPTLATSFNARGIKPDPADPAKYVADRIASKQVVDPEGLSDVDEFHDKFAIEDPCALPRSISPDGIWHVILRDPDGTDVTEQLQQGFREMMGIWVGKKRGRWPHEDEAPCVVWVDAPTTPQPTQKAKYGSGQTAFPTTHHKAAWYDPEAGKWVDE